MYNAIAGPSRLGPVQYALRSLTPFKSCLRCSSSSSSVGLTAATATSWPDRRREKALARSTDDSSVQSADDEDVSTRRPASKLSARRDRTIPFGIKPKRAQSRLISRNRESQDEGQSSLATDEMHRQLAAKVQGIAAWKQGGAFRTTHEDKWQAGFRRGGAAAKLRSGRGEPAMKARSATLMGSFAVASELDGADDVMALGGDAAKRRPSALGSRPGRRDSSQIMSRAVKPIRLVRLDFQQVIPKMMAAKVRSTNSASFQIRAMPVKLLPTNTPSAFERPASYYYDLLCGGDNPASAARIASTSSTSNAANAAADPFSVSRIGSHERDEAEIVRIGIICTKAAVSKFAVERNRTRTRFKAALREATGRAEGESRQLIRPGLTYVVTLRPACFSIPMPELVREVYAAFAGMANRLGTTDGRDRIRDLSGRSRATARSAPAVVV